MAIWSDPVIAGVCLPSAESRRAGHRVWQPKMTSFHAAGRRFRNAAPIPSRNLYAPCCRSSRWNCSGLGCSAEISGQPAAPAPAVISDLPIIHINAPIPDQQNPMSRAGRCQATFQQRNRQRISDQIGEQGGASAGSATALSRRRYLRIARLAVRRARQACQCASKDYVPPHDHHAWISNARR